MSFRIATGPLALLAGLALLPAWPSAALGSWSAADRLSSPSSVQPYGTPMLGIDARGGALATWARNGGRGWRMALRPAGADRFGAERGAPYLGDEVVDRELPAPLVYGSGEAVAIEQQRGRSTCGGFATTYALTARTGPRLATARRLATIFSHQQPPPLAFAGNRHGLALAAWIEYPRDARGRCVRTRGEVLKAAVYRPGAGFGAPVTLMRGVVAQAVAVAVGERGHMLVAIRRTGALETRLRGPSGHWSAARRLAIADARVDAVKAAIAPDGAAWLLWSSARDGVRTVSGAVHRPRTTRFGAARVLERAALPDELLDAPERWRLRIASPERGTGATAAWTSSDGVQLRVMVALARGDDPLEAPTQLTPAGESYVLGDLALGSGRRAIAVASRPAEGPPRALVAVAGGIARFGALEPVGGAGGRLGGEALAIDPVTRQPTLAWTETRVGTASPVTVVLASTRAGVARAATAPSASAAPFLRLDGATAGEQAGVSVAGAGDFNGDGRRDLIVGAPFAAPGGAAYVVYGPFAPGALDLATLGSRGLRISDGSANAMLGESVAGAGDVNGDGLADVVVGAPGTAPGAEGASSGVGHAYVVFGSRRPAAVDVTRLGSRGIVLTGRRNLYPDAFGWSVSGAGDVNRDGRDDVAIAAPGNPGFEDEYTRGSAYVVYGRGHGTVDMARLRGRGFRFGVGSPGDVLSVAGAGDVDGDGYDDVVAGDRGYRGKGAAYLAYGGRRGTVLISGAPRGAEFGYAVAGGGDVNGDGLDDIVVSEPQAHRSSLNQSGGGAWLIRGSRHRGPIDVRRRGVELRGTPGDWAGFAVALGRVNADRRPDIVLTERGSLAVVYGSRHPAPLRLPTGASWLIDGTLEANPGFSAPDSGGFTTAGVLGGGPVLAGAGLADHNARENSGSAYVFFGGKPAA